MMHKYKTGVNIRVSDKELERKLLSDFKESGAIVFGLNPLDFKSTVMELRGEGWKMPENGLDWIMPVTLLHLAIRSHMKKYVNETTMISYQEQPDGLNLNIDSDDDYVRIFNEVVVYCLSDKSLGSLYATDYLHVKHDVVCIKNAQDKFLSRISDYVITIGDSNADVPTEGIEYDEIFEDIQKCFNKRLDL